MRLRCANSAGVRHFRVTRLAPRKLHSLHFAVHSYPIRESRYGQVRRVEARQEEVFRDKLSQLVFYVGATGLLPDEMDAKALTADQLGQKYPDLALSKDEKEGTFFEIGDTILTVYAKTEYFSR